MVVADNSMLTISRETILPRNKTSDDRVSKYETEQRHYSHGVTGGRGTAVCHQGPWVKLEKNLLSRFGWN